MKYHQTENAECGLICLAYASARLGAELDVSELRRRYGGSSRGLSLKQLSEIAAALNLEARAVRCELDELSGLKLPAILHWRMNHFVVLERVRKKSIVVHDPAKGRLTFSLDEAGRLFSGVALEIHRTEQFQRRKERSPLTLWSWVSYEPQMLAGLGQVLLLSLMLQAYVVASPFYIQLAVDQAALRGDLRMLTTLAIGFGLFGLFNVGATVLRNFAMQQIGANLVWNMSLRLFRHLVRLPLGWFQRRRLADTISRFDSVKPIRDLLSGVLVTALIDGLLAVTTLGLMFYVSWRLALVVAAGVVLYGVLRLCTLPLSLRMSSETLGAQIAENSKRIETIKAIQTIKIMGAESEQEAQWANKFANYVRRDFLNTRTQAAIKAAFQALEVITSTAVVFIGVNEIIEKSMTVGVLYAFLAYRSQFSSAVTNVIEQVIQVRMTDIYSFRLADIVLTPREEGIDRVETSEVRFEGRIEVENLYFRYSTQDGYVFKNLNFTIEPGEYVAIVGRSGSGKSTLLKIMCGLYAQSAGEVRVDGKTLSAWGPRAFRSTCGVVLQDDELLSGTIADNVAFFDETIDIDRVWEVLEAAGLREEVAAMPMQVETFVGDMGGALSGGQKQRLLIARALYKQPSLLFLDEATSHLDVRREGHVNRSLKGLKTTRVVIAHRIETIRTADRVFDLERGCFVGTGAEFAARRAPPPASAPTPVTV